MLTIKNICTFEHILFLMLCVVSVFSYSSNMIDSYIVPKWCFTCMVLLGGFIVLSIKYLCGNTPKWNSIICGYIISFTCGFQAIYGIIQCLKQSFSSGFYNISGSFDNPAGYAACLCMGLPFIIQYFPIVKKRKNLLFSVFLIMLALFLSGSRAGIIGGMSVIFLSKCTFFFRKDKKYFLVSLFLILFIIGGYLLKKDSADGRLLIWRCSWNMIKESPVYGHGTGYFLKKYMDYQASYFDKYPNSQFSMLADNVQHPFNEYMSVILNFGFIGGMLLLVVMVLLYCAYRRTPNHTNTTAILSLFATAIIAFFSYPFTYPFTWILCLYCICVLLKSFFIWKIPQIYCQIVYGLVLILCVVSIAPIYQRTMAEYRWYKAYKKQRISDYKLLMPILGNDPYFLYNYAVELYNANHINESKNVSVLCQQQWSNYDLEILLGDIYMHENEIVLAESHYKQAASMCPCRFIPLYQLFNLYRKNGNTNKAYIMAQKIEKKPIKIQSAMVGQIKYKVKRYLKSSDQ